MKSSIFTFAYDLHDEGIDTVLDNVQQRGQLDAVTLAFTYHHSRDIFPHNPRRKMIYMEGHVLFRADESRYLGLKIQPPVSPLLMEHDVVADLITETQRRGLNVRAWTNNVHNTTIGKNHLDCVARNAFGDPFITTLCATNPDVRAYLCAITADLARYPLESILLESVNFMGFRHGYHHERNLLPLTPLMEFMLSLCFCEHCKRHAQAQNIDAERVHTFVHDALEKALNGDPCAFDTVALLPSAIDSLDAELWRYVQARFSTITTLVGEMRQAVRRVSDTPLIYMEQSGGLRGASTGGMVAHLVNNLSLSRAWQDGVDVGAVAQACDGLSVLGYIRENDQLQTDIAAYREHMPSDASLSVAVRPMLPDCDSLDELSERVAALRQCNVDWLDFYHYGMMRLKNLDWIGQALTQ
jgi:hypothetical protein